MHIFGFCTPKICIETQLKFLWFWPRKPPLWDSMMLILAAREILYTGPLICCLKGEEPNCVDRTFDRDVGLFLWVTGDC